MGFRETVEELRNSDDYKRYLESIAYIMDPCISRHDKDLQHALDFPMIHPDVSEEETRKLLDAFDPQLGGFCIYEMRFRGSEEEFRDELQKSLLPRNRRRYWKQYIKHQKLVEEAVAKGFVKKGRCQNVLTERRTVIRRKLYNLIHCDKKSKAPFSENH